MLDVTKYLNKMNIQINKITEKSIVFIDNNEIKEIDRKELEKYLFICLTDFIKESK